LGTLPPSQKEALQAETYTEFPEQGVKYAGYSRKRISNGQYALRVQSTRYSQMVVNDGAAGSHPFTRPEAATKNFICTKAIIQIFRAGIVAPSVLYISDVTGTASAVRIPIREYQATTLFYELNFSMCPRVFTGNAFDIYVQTSVTAPNEVCVTLFGFDEDK